MAGKDISSPSSSASSLPTLSEFVHDGLWRLLSRPSLWFLLLATAAAAVVGQALLSSSLSGKVGYSEEEKMFWIIREREREREREGQREREKDRGKERKTEGRREKREVKEEKSHHWERSEDEELFILIETHTTLTLSFGISIS